MARVKDTNGRCVVRVKVPRGLLAARDWMAQTRAPLVRTVEGHRWVALQKECCNRTEAVGAETWATLNEPQRLVRWGRASVLPSDENWDRSQLRLQGIQRTLDDSLFAL